MTKISSIDKKSQASLIIANLIPLVGILFFDWDIFSLLFLYWAESGVIGFYNIVKMVKTQSLSVLRYVMVPFFMIHYGGFMLGHLVFLFVFFYNGGIFSGEEMIIKSEIFSSAFFTVWPFILVLFISHGMSFFENFLQKSEFEKLNLEDLMVGPYKRIIVMHIVLLIGGVGLVFLGVNNITLSLVILLKIILDLRYHIKIHENVNLNKIKTN